MARIEVKVKLDLPAGVQLLGYERCGEGHGFEVKFPLPLYCRCEKCPIKQPARYEYNNTVYVVRDLDLWGQPSFLIFQPCLHRCSRCGHRQEHFAPFKSCRVSRGTSPTFFWFLSARVGLAPRPIVQLLKAVQ